MKPDSLSFGFMYNETTMMSMYKVIPKPQAEIVFRQDIYRREIVVEFTIRIRNPQMSEGNTSKNADILHSGRFDRTETIRFSIPFSQLQAIQRVQSGENKMGLVISLETPPRFFRKLDELMTHEKDGRYWNQNDAWYRQTDIVYDPTRLRSSELTLIKSDPILDIGKRCFDCHVLSSLTQNRPLDHISLYFRYVKK